MILGIPFDSKNRLDTQDIFSYSMGWQILLHIQSGLQLTGLCAGVLFMPKLSAIKK